MPFWYNCILLECGRFFTMPEQAEYHIADLEFCHLFPDSLHYTSPINSNCCRPLLYHLAMVKLLPVEGVETDCLQRNADFIRTWFGHGNRHQFQGSTLLCCLKSLSHF